MKYFELKHIKLKIDILNLSKKDIFDSEHGHPTGLTAHCRLDIHTTDVLNTRLNTSARASAGSGLVVCLAKLEPKNCSYQNGHFWRLLTNKQWSPLLSLFTMFLCGQYMPTHIAQKFTQISVFLFLIVCLLLSFCFMYYCFALGRIPFFVCIMLFFIFYSPYEC